MSIVNTKFPLPVTSLNIHISTNTIEPTSDIAKLDSGTSHHYLKPEHTNFLHNINTPEAQHIINLSNNTTITATKQGQLHLHPSLPMAANTAPILP